MIPESVGVSMLLIWLFWSLVIEPRPFDRPDGGEEYYTKCHWCDKECYTESIRAIHLRRQHPKFFEKYDEMNDWLFTDKIPERPKYFRCRKCEFETDNHREIVEHVHNHTDKDREEPSIRRRSFIDYSDEFKNMSQKEQLRLVKTVTRKPEGDNYED